MFQLFNAVLVYFVHFGLTFVEHLDALVEVFAHAFQFNAFLLQFFNFLGQSLFALFQFIFVGGDFGVAFRHLFVVFAFHLQVFFLGLQNFVFLYHFGLGFGID